MRDASFPVGGSAHALASRVTEAWLTAVPFEVVQAEKAVSIEDVHLRVLSPILDGRGALTELWSERWEGFHRTRHVYQTTTDVGVVKAWHLHGIHWDQLAVTRGKVQVVLADVRPESVSFGHVNAFVFGVERPALLSIPPGVLHGWKALSAPDAIVVNCQTEAYDPADEFKFAWNCVLSDIWEPRNR